MADAPKGGNSLEPEVRRHSQQALLSYADKTLKRQIEASFQVKQKAARERRAFRLEAQAAAMRAELALLQGDSFASLWPCLPDAIQQRAEKRRREQQQVMWLVACDSSPPDHVHSQHASASKLPLHDRTGESSNLHQVNEPATNNAPSHAELGQVYVPAEASSSSDARVSTADPPRGSRRVTAESSSSESAAGGESASSYSGVSVPSGAFSIGANLSLSADGTSSSEAGVDEPSAEQPSNSSIIGCAMVTLSAAEAVLPPPLPTRAPQRCYIGNMAVAIPRRRQGVAKALLQACERVAKRWRYDSVWLHTETSNASAQKLYMRAGYERKRVDPWFYGRMRQVLLSKQLPQHRTEDWRDSIAQSVQQCLVEGGQRSRSSTYVWKVRSHEPS